MGRSKSHATTVIATGNDFRLRHYLYYSLQVQTYTSTLLEIDNLFHKMLRTQTAQEPTTVSETLRIYDVYETGREGTSETSLNSAQNAVEQAQLTTQLNENWPSDWRRVPPYRESSRTHRVSDRAAGQDVAEAAIVVTMFHGVWIMGVRI